MLKLLKQILGTFLLTWGSFLFYVFTIDLSANIRIAGPMNMWPPPVWVYLILDCIFVLIAFIGMNLMGLKRRVCGAVMIIVSVLALFFIMTKHVNAPPRDALSDGRYLPAKVEAYVLAYMIVASVLGVGLWFIIPDSWRRELS